MKYSISLLVTIIILLFLPSCSYPYDIPFGIWQSSEPHLILNIDPKVLQEQKEFTGIYFKDGEELDLIIRFGANMRFTIYDIRYFSVSREELSKYFYFSGAFSIKDDKIYYKMVNQNEDIPKYNTIIFEKIEDYDVE